MNPVANVLLTDLRHVIADLGQQGGLCSPSVYNTAQVVRLAPPAEGVGPALEWLMSKQNPDGGWGEPVVARARDLPTLAALLTLHTYNTYPGTREALREGLAFLERQAAVWEGPLPEDLTAGIELMLPRLLDEAEQVGLPICRAPYAALIALGERRRVLIARLKPRAGTTAAHSWEAWGNDPDPALLDGVGSVGHSPSATAWWVKQATGRDDLAETRAAAQDYLRAAAEGCGVNIPGVVSTCWPTPRFEQVFALHSLLISGLLHHPALSDVVRPQLDDIAQALKPNGLGFSDVFSPDGDDTAACLSVLFSSGYEVESSPLKHFAYNNHFCAWQGELQPSLSVTAHAAHTLALFGEDTTEAEAFIIERQLPDGRWPGDKWNGSWLYTTWRAIIALQGTSHVQAVLRATDALLAHQHPDGSWGTHVSNAEETAYGVLALRAILRGGIVHSGVQQALNCAEEWLLHNYRPFAPSTTACWLGKEAYRPLRISRTIELAATIPYTYTLENDAVKMRCLGC